ncbi:CpaF family protein [Nocardioides bruguierae]|uniref:CpaF family protein n=1 Tax=Nocardioides bruguierae TaxID=2945102 RepID=UPI002020809F|nr:CpaF family protein [Nocardioides bruguierae]MCL8024822.1 CpaF family protein [Nocardioides bruguierae]
MSLADRLAAARRESTAGAHTATTPGTTPGTAEPTGVQDGAATPTPPQTPSVAPAQPAPATVTALTGGPTATGRTTAGSHTGSGAASGSAAPGRRSLRADVEAGKLARSTDPIADLKRQVHAQLVAALGPKLYDVGLTPAELETQVRAALASAVAGAERPMSGPERTRITQEIADDILGYGPLQPLLDDPDLTEVMVNRSDDIWVERDGRLTKVPTAFTDEAHLRRTIDKIVAKVGRRVDESSPMVDARLPDGSRVNAVIPPLVLDGSTLTIRKFSADPYTVDDLVGFGTLSAESAELLSACVRGRLNILVSGGTGAGKTTTLNVLSSAIPADERIVTIEDAAELRLMQEHVIRMEARPANIEGRGAVTIRDLVRNALRMRPDRIVVGEIRDAAALDMLQAMNTGHDGSLSTVHANSPRDALARVETMVMMAGLDLPVRAIREQVSSAIDLVVQQRRLKDGSRRITSITEVVGMEGDVVTLQEVFSFDHSAGWDEQGRTRGHLRATGLRPRFLETLADANVRVDPALFLTRAGA